MQFREGKRMQIWSAVMREGRKYRSLIVVVGIHGGHFRRKRRFYHPYMPNGLFQESKKIFRPKILDFRGQINILSLIYKLGLLILTKSEKLTTMFGTFFRINIFYIFKYFFNNNSYL